MIRHPTILTLHYTDFFPIHIHIISQIYYGEKTQGTRTILRKNMQVSIYTHTSHVLFKYECHIQTLTEERKSKTKQKKKKLF